MSCLCQLPDECIARNSELQDLSSCPLCFFTLYIYIQKDNSNTVVSGRVLNKAKKPRSVTQLQTV